MVNGKWMFWQYIPLWRFAVHVHVHVHVHTRNFCTSAHAHLSLNGSSNSHKKHIKCVKDLNSGGAKKKLSHITNWALPFVQCRMKFFFSTLRAYIATIKCTLYSKLFDGFFSAMHRKSSHISQSCKFVAPRLLSTLSIQFVPKAIWFHIL